MEPSLSTSKVQTAYEPLKSRVEVDPIFVDIHNILVYFEEHTCMRVWFAVFWKSMKQQSESDLVNSGRVAVQVSWSQFLE